MLNRKRIFCFCILIIIMLCFISCKEKLNNTVINEYKIACNNNCVYYIDSSGKLYKITKDNKDKTLITSNVSEFYIFSDWIYYCLTGSTGSNDIYKIKTDGTFKTRIDSIPDIKWMHFASDKFIYYSDYNFTGLRKLNIDNGNKETILTEYDYYHIDSYNGTIIGEAADDEDRLMIIKEKEGHTEKIVYGSIISCDNNILCYLNEDHQICSINLDGKNNIIYGGSNIIKAKKYEDNVFYTKENKMYKFNLSTKTEFFLNTNDVENILLADRNCIYYKKTGDRNNIYRLLLDNMKSEKLG